MRQTDVDPSLRKWGFWAGVIVMVTAWAVLATVELAHRLGIHRVWIQWP